MRSESAPISHRSAESGVPVHFGKGSTVYLYPSENAWGWQSQNGFTARSYPTEKGKRSKFELATPVELYYNGKKTSRGPRTPFWADPRQIRKIK